MTAADAARRGRSSLDIKKSDRATLSVFIQQRSPAITFLSLSLSLSARACRADTARGCGGPRPPSLPLPRLLSSALVKTIASTWRFRVIDCRGNRRFPCIVARWAVTVTAENGEGYNSDELGFRWGRHARVISYAVFMMTKAQGLASEINYIILIRYSNR